MACGFLIQGVDVVVVVVVFVIIITHFNIGTLPPLTRAAPASTSTQGEACDEVPVEEVQRRQEQCREEDVEGREERAVRGADQPQRVGLFRLVCLIRPLQGVHPRCRRRRRRYLSLFLGLLLRGGDPRDGVQDGGEELPRGGQ